MNEGGTVKGLNKFIYRMGKCVADWKRRFYKHLPSRAHRSHDPVLQYRLAYHSQVTTILHGCAVVHPISKMIGTNTIGLYSSHM